MLTQSQILDTISCFSEKEYSNNEINSGTVETPIIFDSASQHVMVTSMLFNNPVFSVIVSSKTLCQVFFNPVMSN